MINNGGKHRNLITKRIRTVTIKLHLIKSVPTTEVMSFAGVKPVRAIAVLEQRTSEQITPFKYFGCSILFGCNKRYNKYRDKNVYYVQNTKI